MADLARNTPEEVNVTEMVMALVEEVVDNCETVLLFLVRGIVELITLIGTIVLLFGKGTVELIALIPPRYIPAAGRFLIVCTFIEDAIRIMTQWGDQLLYLHDYRHSTLTPISPRSPPLASNANKSQFPGA